MFCLIFILFNICFSKLTFFQFINSLSLSPSSFLASFTMAPPELTQIRQCITIVESILREKAHIIFSRCVKAICSDQTNFFYKFGPILKIILENKLRLRLKHCVGKNQYVVNLFGNDCLNLGADILTSEQKQCIQTFLQKFGTKPRGYHPAFTVYECKQSLAISDEVHQYIIHTFVETSYLTLLQYNGMGAALNLLSKLEEPFSRYACYPPDTLSASCTTLLNLIQNGRYSAHLRTQLTQAAHCSNYA